MPRSIRESLESQLLSGLVLGFLLFNISWPCYADSGPVGLRFHLSTGCRGCGSTEFGRRSSTRWYWSSRQPWSNGIARVPSPTWRSFLRNHLPDIAAIDMFVVATATFQLLYTLIVLSLDRRRVVHFEVTTNPTQDWLSGQITEAFPWDTAPLSAAGPDKSYGPAFRHRVRAMGITEVITAPRSPWQNPYVERLIGSIRRECLDHVIILIEHHLRRVLSSYFQYHASFAQQGLSTASSCTATFHRQ
jgi:hypothetical protein